MRVGEGEGLAVLQPEAEVGELGEQAPQLGSGGVGDEGVQAQPGACGEQPLVGAVLVIGGLDQVLGEADERGRGGVEGAQFPQDEIVLRVDPVGAAQHGGPQGAVGLGLVRRAVRAVGQRSAVEPAQAQQASQRLDQLPRREPVPQRDDTEEGQLGPEFLRSGVAQAGRDQPVGHLCTVEEWPPRALGNGRGEVPVAAPPGGHDRSFHPRERGDFGHRQQERCRAA